MNTSKFWLLHSTGNYYIITKGTTQDYKSRKTHKINRFYEENVIPYPEH